MAKRSGQRAQLKDVARCNYCKRRDGSHAPKCRRRTGRKRRPVTRRDPAAGRAAAVDAMAGRALDLVRQKIDEEIEATQAYLDALRRLRASA